MIKDDVSNIELVPLSVAARELGCSSYTEALNSVIAGRIPCERIRGRWYVPRKTLEIMLASASPK